MATKTEIYEFRKKEENDFYNVEDFNNNMDMMETALTEFDDSGTAEGVTSFPDMLAKLVTGNKLAVTLKNLKAGLQFVLHAGSIVNNCVTDNPNLPLSAAQGKALQDLITVLNNELKEISSNLGVFGTPYTVAENFIAKEDGFLNLTINPTSLSDSYIQLNIGSRYLAGSSNAAGHQYNVFACVKKNDKVIVMSGNNADRQTWTFIPLSGNK